MLGRSLVGGALAAESGTVTIAYNVNLPSCDPTVGASAVNPTIQALYQSVFDPYIGQKPDLAFKPGLLTEWGWNDDRTKVDDEVREGATWHDGYAGHRRGRGLVAGARRRREDRQPDPVRLVEDRQLQDRRQQDHRRREASSSRRCSSGWRSSPATSCPKAYYEKVGAEGFEKKPIGTGPYMVDKFERNAFLRLKANPNYWGGKPAFDTVDLQVRPRRDEPRRRDRSPAQSDVTLEIPYEEFDRLKPRTGLRRLRARRSPTSA